MNHIYRLVWNNAVRAWQPVSEFAAQTRGGRASAGLCAPMRWPRHALAVALALGPVRLERDGDGGQLPQ